MIRFDRIILARPRSGLTLTVSQKCHAFAEPGQPSPSTRRDRYSMSVSGRSIASAGLLDRLRLVGYARASYLLSVFFRKGQEAHPQLLGLVHPRCHLAEV
jgi:hypothetical protein